jgi:hypothetical protein
MFYNGNGFKNGFGYAIKNNSTAIMSISCLTYNHALI